MQELNINEYFLSDSYVPLSIYDLNGAISTIQSYFVKPL